MSHPDLESQQTGAAAIIEQVTKVQEPKLITLKLGDIEAPVLLASEHVDLYSVKEQLDEYRTKPERRKGKARFAELASFIAHANRFKSDHSAIFAEPETPSLTSVLDYHEKTHTGAPAFGEHRGIYSFPMSDEWKAWKSKNGVKMGQADFAAFIEDRLLDVADPASALKGASDFATTLGAEFASGSKLLALSRGLSVTVNQQVKNAVALGSGEAQITFVEQHTNEQGAPIKVPGAFIIAIPVFKAGALYQLPVRLRYRTEGGRVIWFYEISQADKTFDHAFKEACDQAAKETGLPLFVGSPES